MARYEDASVKAYTSLAVLNAGQAVIFTLGLAAAMVMCAFEIKAGTKTVGDFVLINAMMIQLYQPLNFMGMVYREIKQALIDIETMFSILAREPEIKDAPGAQPLKVTSGTIRFEDVALRLRAGAADPQGHLASRCRPARRSRWSARPAPASRPSRGCCSASTTSSGGRILIDGQDIAQGDAEVAARRDRHGAAGHRAVQRHHPLQHPLRPLGSERRRGGGGGAGSRRSTASSACRRRATRPRSASAA